MALSYNSFQALIARHYLPTLPDVIFRNHPLLAVLKAKAKTFNERKIFQPLEYGDETTVQAIAAYTPLVLQNIDPFTAAEYTPKMAVATLTVSHEDILQANSPNAVHNIITSKMNNVKKSFDKYFATRLWSRATTATDEWSSIQDLVSNSVTVGGIAVADASWWKSGIIDGTTFGANVKDNLTDSSSDGYLFAIIQRLVASAKYQSGENPDMIILPTYLWNTLEAIFINNKLGSKMNEKLASLGFTALDYHGIGIVADDDMVLQQTSDTDGRIYCLNTDYLYMFFNSGARFKMGPFIEPENRLSRTAKITAYGNMVISNRTTCSCCTGVYSPRTYANVNA